MFPRPQRLPFTLRSSLNALARGTLSFNACRHIIANLRGNCQAQKKKPQNADAPRIFTRSVKQAGALPIASAVPWRCKNGGMTLLHLDPGSIYEMSGNNRNAVAHSRSICEHYMRAAACCQALIHVFLLLKSSSFTLADPSSVYVKELFIMLLESSAYAAPVGTAAGGRMHTAAAATAAAMVIAIIRMMYHRALFAKEALCCVGHATPTIGAQIVGIGASLQLVSGRNHPIHAQGHSHATQHCKGKLGFGQPVI